MPIASSADTVMAVFLVAVLALGYVLLWAIWRFFFRDRGVQHRDPGWSPRDEDRR
jgi:hypothetical protein